MKDFSTMVAEDLNAEIELYREAGVVDIPKLATKAQKIAWLTQAQSEYGFTVTTDEGTTLSKEEASDVAAPSEPEPVEASLAPVVPVTPVASVTPSVARSIVKKVAYFEKELVTKMENIVRNGRLYIDLHLQHPANGQTRTVRLTKAEADAQVVDASGAPTTK